MKFHSRLKSEDLDALFEAVLQLKNEEECYRFFEDLCTITELKAISQRLQVAKLLYNKKTYNEIEEQTMASTATISRINKALNYGADGYKLVIDRLVDKDNKKEKSKK